VNRGTAWGAVLCLLVVPGAARAWFESSEVGPRALSLGGAFVSVADDPSAIYWNPAGLVQLRRHEVLLSGDRTADLPELENGFAAAAFHAAPLVIGIGWQHASLDGAATEDLWSLSVAATPVRRSLGAFLAGGASLKLGRIGIDAGGLGPMPGLAASDFGIAADVGLLVAPIPNVSLGVTLRNLGEPRFDLFEGGSSTRLEREVEWGVSLRWRRDGWLHFGRVRHPGGSASTRAGVELRVAGPLGVRLGVGSDAVSGGVDVRVGRWTLDTAYRAHESLGTTYRVGLRLAFGRPRSGVGGEYDEF
jgi:hypothetical protein